MRLIRAVARLEAGAAARAREPEERPAPVGVCWSSEEVTLDPGDLGEGEYLAVDLVVEELGEGARTMRITERVTCDVGDLGVVRDGEGRRIGRVVAVSPTLLSYEVDGGETVEMERG